MHRWVFFGAESNLMSYIQITAGGINICLHQGNSRGRARHRLVMISARVADKHSALRVIKGD